MWKINITCDTRGSDHGGHRCFLKLLKVPHLGHLLKWALEAQISKWSQRTSALQLFWPEGRSEEKKRKRKQERTTQGDEALSKARSFIFKGSLYTLSCA